LKQVLCIVAVLFGQLFCLLPHLLRCLLPNFFTQTEKNCQKRNKKEFSELWRAAENHQPIYCLLTFDFHYKEIWWLLAAASQAEFEWFLYF